MFNVHVRLAALVVACIALLGMSTVKAAPGTATTYQSSRLLPPQVYIPTVLQEANSQSLTPALYIRSARAYDWTDKSGRRTLRIVGEFVNDSSINFNDVKVLTYYFDKNGKFMEGGINFPKLFRTFPGQATSFEIVDEYIPPEVSEYYIALSAHQDAPDRWINLPIVNEGVRDNQGVEVFGDVLNNTSGEVSSAIVALTLYDADGEVVDVDSYSYPSHFAPNAQYPFSITTRNTDPSITEYLVQAQGFPSSSESGHAATQQITNDPSTSIRQPANAKLLPLRSLDQSSID